MIKVICSGQRSHDVAARTKVETDIFKAKWDVAATWRDVFASMAKKEEVNTQPHVSNHQCLNGIVWIVMEMV
jgi:hypothetical protein